MRRAVRWLPLLTTISLALGGCGGESGLALGTEAEVGHVDAATQAATALAITVEEVRRGTVEELEAAGLQFDDDERDLVPYYVDATYRNTGDVEVERTMRVSSEDASGNLVSPTIVLDFGGGGEDAGPCPDVDEGGLAPGQSFEDCTLFLYPAGSAPASVTFLSQPAGEEPEFVRWSVPEVS
jgi:predicted small lipoprotein YifL